MKTKLSALLLVITLILVASVVLHICIDVVQLHRIELSASKIEEPAYTLVVNGDIIHHNYTASFDRFYTDGDTHELSGFEHGEVEVPLLTVLAAIGADITWVSEDVAKICYAEKVFVFLPEYAAIFPNETYANITEAQLSMEEALNSRNLIILPDNRPDDFIRMENGEYLLQLGGWHLLAMSLDFTFKCDYERGILFFISSKVYIL